MHLWEHKYCLVVAYKNELSRIRKTSRADVHDVYDLNAYSHSKNI